jgi:probable rRNA maturation factor
MISWVLLAEDTDQDIGVTVILAGDELLQQLNREHRDLDEPTDVLSFPAAEGEQFPGEPEQAPYLGDIAISVPRVRQQALAASMDAEEELRHVVLHGLLHLMGYDHETPEDDRRMRTREEAVLGPGIHAGRDEDAHSDS